jgi:hypothetical protein
MRVPYRNFTPVGGWGVYLAIPWHVVQNLELNTGPCKELWVDPRCLWGWMHRIPFVPISYSLEKAWRCVQSCYQTLFVLLLILKSPWHTSNSGICFTKRHSTKKWGGGAGRKDGRELPSIIHVTRQLNRTSIAVWWRVPIWSSCT